MSEVPLYAPPPRLCPTRGAEGGHVPRRMGGSAVLHMRLPFDFI